MRRCARERWRRPVGPRTSRDRRTGRRPRRSLPPRGSRSWRSSPRRCLGPVGAAPALAADDGLALALDVDRTRSSPTRASSTSPSTSPRRTTSRTVDPSGTITTRYFFDVANDRDPGRGDGDPGDGRQGERSRRRSTPDDGFAIVQVSFRERPAYQQTTRRPRRLRPARRRAALRQRHPGRVGVRDVLRLGVRRPRRRPDRRPAGFEVETSGSTDRRDRRRTASRRSPRPAIADPTEWYAVVVADRHDALTQRPARPRRRRARRDPGLARGHGVADAGPRPARDGLPVLVEKIGLDWPVEGDIEVAEVHTPLLEGYAGVFYTDEDRIEISEDLDELTIVHEASHAWFNADLFVGRWINEGFADEYASRVLDEVSVGGLGPGRGLADVDGRDRAQRLGASRPDRRRRDRATASTSATRRRGRSIRALVDEIGEDADARRSSPRPTPTQTAVRRRRASRRRSTLPERLAALPRPARGGRRLDDRRGRVPALGRHRPTQEALLDARAARPRPRTPRWSSRRRLAARLRRSATRWAAGSSAGRRRAIDEATAVLAAATRSRPRPPSSASRRRRRCATAYEGATERSRRGPRAGVGAARDGDGARRGVAIGVAADARRVRRRSG